MRRPLFIAVLLVFVAAAFAGAWRLADVEEGNVAYIAGGVLALLGMASALVAWISRSDEKLTPEGRWKYQRFAILMVAATAAWWTGALLGHTPSTIVYVDNQSDQDVELLLDGEPWIESERKSTNEARITFGEHEIVTLARDGRQELDRLKVKAEPSPVTSAEGEEYHPYVFNVLRAAKYINGLASYGDVAKNSETETDEAWILADVDLLFQEPPTTISTSAGATYALIKYLARADDQ
jgi:hypothetical protein